MFSVDLEENNLPNGYVNESGPCDCEICLSVIEPQIGQKQDRWQRDSPIQCQ